MPVSKKRKKPKANISAVKKSAKKYDFYIMQGQWPNPGEPFSGAVKETKFTTYQLHTILSDPMLSIENLREMMEAGANVLHVEGKIGGSNPYSLRHVDGVSPVTLQ